MQAALHAWDADDREQALSHTRAAVDVVDRADLGDTDLASHLRGIVGLLHRPGAVGDRRWDETGGRLDRADEALLMGVWNEEDVSYNPRRRGPNPDTSLGVLGYAAAGAAVGAVSVRLLRGQSAETELTDLSMAAAAAAIVGYLIGGRRALVASSIGGLGGAFVSSARQPSEQPLLPPGEAS